MTQFFSRERFGKPQVFAGLMLLVFVAECAWLLVHTPPNLTGPGEFVRVQEGLEQWRGHGIAGTPSIPTALSSEVQQPGDYDPDHSPLWYLIGSAPVALLGVNPSSAPGLWLSRSPYVLFGVLLGASLWYVSRRLYGNAGG